MDTFSAGAADPLPESDHHEYRDSDIDGRALSPAQYSHLSAKLIRRAVLVIGFVLAVILAMMWSDM
jgi:hypothetical protein